jgi:hypothetical protein
MAKSKPRTLLLAVWFLLWPLLFWIFWTPIPYSFLKMTALLAIALLWLGALVIFPRGRPLCVVIFLAVLGVSLWPARPVDSARLTRSYVWSLFKYQNTPYVWGGENGRGIDCSGLIRRGFIDALLSQGWDQRNPALWRETAIIWWRDCSAREMKNGYSGRIEPRFAARSLNELDTTQLQIGDLAVMRSGVHVLAFVGGRSWIQADPNLVNGGDKVIVTEAPSRSGWFGQLVVICRWKMLDAKR